MIRNDSAMKEPKKVMIWSRVRSERSQSWPKVLAWLQGPRRDLKAPVCGPTSRVVRRRSKSPKVNRGCTQANQVRKSENLNFSITTVLKPLLAPTQIKKKKEFSLFRWLKKYLQRKSERETVNKKAENGWKQAIAKTSLLEWSVEPTPNSANFRNGSLELFFRVAFKSHFFSRGPLWFLLCCSSSLLFESFGLSKVLETFRKFGSETRRKF